MKRIHITCPYCHSKAFLRPASAVYGKKNDNPAAKVYVCARFPACDSYVAAFPDSNRPMGTLADKTLRRKRCQAHRAFDRLWKSGLMTRQEAYRLMQLHFGIPSEDAHIAKFDTDRCDRLIRFCRQFYHNAAPKAA